MSYPSHNAPTPGAALRKLRQFRNLTIEQLAAAAGLSPQTLHALESEHSALDIAVVHRLAEALAVNPVRIAFPDRRSGSRPPRGVRVSGTVTLHGQPVGDRFTVQLEAGCGLRICAITQSVGRPAGCGRYWLDVYPVNLATLWGFELPWRYDHQRLELQGDQLGVLGSSYGDQDLREPPDDDIRLLSRCRLERHHVHSGIRFHIEGVAQELEGRVLRGRPISEPPGPWSFEVRFEVPIEEVEAFYGETPLGGRRWREHLESLP